MPVAAAPDPEIVAQLSRHKVLQYRSKDVAIAHAVVRNLLAWPPHRLRNPREPGDPDRRTEPRRRRALHGAATHRPGADAGSREWRPRDPPIS